MKISLQFLKKCLLIIAGIVGVTPVSLYSQNLGFEATPPASPPSGWTAVTGTWNTATGAANVRTGNQSMSITDPATTGTTMGNGNTITVVPTAGTHFIITMAYARSNLANGVLYLGIRSGTTNTLNPTSTTTGQPINMSTASFTRIISVTANTVAAGNYGVSMRAFRNATSPTGTTIFIDDVISYISTINRPDTFAPGSITGGSALIGSPFNLSWTNPIDDTTNSSGMRGTLILRTAATTTVAPTMNAQALYNPAGGALGVSSFVDGGNTWEVVGRIDNNSTTSFSDLTAISSTSYTYALVSYDNAFNYGTPHIVTPIPGTPMVYLSSTVSQVTGFTPVGRITPVNRLEVITSGNSSPLLISNFFLRTIGSTNPSADLTNALIYSTKNIATFDTTRLLGTFTSPSGGFAISGTDTLLTGSNFYWLAYNISTSAANCNLIDGAIDSIIISSTRYIPTITSPLGFVQVQRPLSGIYTVDSFGTSVCGGSNFRSLKSIADYMNINGISGPVTINMASANPIFSESVTFGNISGQSAVNTITINGNGNEIASNLSPVISFNNSSFITLDSLRIVHIPETGFGVHITNQSRNITIRKCFINVGITSTATTNAGIVVSGSSTSATATGNNGRFITINNNTVIGGFYGIIFTGNTGYLDNTNNIISNNTLQDFYSYGIYMLHGDSNVIDGNNISRATRTSLTTLFGIFFSQSRFSKINNNRIHTTGTASYTANGIQLVNCINTAGFETEVINNAIYNINQSAGIFYGIYGLTTNFTGFKIYYNTIHYIVPTASTSVVRGFWAGVAPNNVDFRNNIISITGGGTGVKTGIYVTTTSTTFTSNRNVIFVNTSASNNIGFWGAVNATLASWQTASGQDLNSTSVNPVFSSAINITPLSSNVDNLGLPVGGITLDINGTTRSTTTPDAGVVEFIGYADDMVITNVQTAQSSPNRCYSSNDTLKITVQNLIGNTIDFTVNPLTIVWISTGPVISSDSIIINTDTLPLGAFRTVTVSNLNRSSAGNYSLRAFLRPNAVNTSRINDTTSFITNTVTPILSTSTVPTSRIANSPTDSIVLTARSPIFPGGNLFISEICHWRGATGAAPAGGWPTYLIADDYIEITGVPNTDIGGFTLEEWTGTTMQHSVTFPIGTLFSPSGTMIIATGQLTTSVPSPVNFYYHSGNTVTHGSTGVVGYIIKNNVGNIVDAVTYGAYSFPVSSGVTTTDWSGSTPSVSSAGIRLIAPDNNTNSSWATESATQRQDPNTLNSALTVPAPTTLTGFNWIYLGSSIGTTPRLRVGPYTVPGVYTYIAEYINTCGTFRDTIVVTATSNVPVDFVSFTAKPSNSDAVLNWQTASETNNSHFIVERSLDANAFTAVGKIKGKGNSQILSSYTYTDKDIGSNNSFVYYRLRQVDFDGTTDITNIVSVDFSSTKENELSIAPNPFDTRFAITLNGTENDEAVISIMDIQGKICATEKYVLQNGLNTLTIQSSENLENGVYFIRVTTSLNTQTLKVIKH